MKTAKVVELRYELLPHPPFSLDLICDFVLVKRGGHRQMQSLIKHTYLLFEDL